MRISVWSSDVCSADLHDQSHFFARVALNMPTVGMEQMPSLHGIFHAVCDFDAMDRLGDVWENASRLQLSILVVLYLNLLPEVRKIGRASCRERVCQYV